MTSILEGLVLDGLDLNAVATSTSSAYQTAALALSPALYWRHGETGGTTANDTSGNSRTGTYAAGVTLGATGLLAGDTDKAISLDGTANAKVTSTYNPFTGNMTVCGWANATSLAAARNLFGGSAAGSPLLQIQTNGSITWWSDLTAATQTWVAGTWTAATTIFWALTWNNATKVSELFINGVSQGTKTSVNAFNATPGNFGLATSSAGAGFLGVMDETLVFAGTILSAANITALYNAGSVAAASSAFRMQGYEVPPPNKRQEWAQGADIDGALLVRDPLFDNREITLRLRVAKQATMDAALAQIAALSKKLEESEQQPDGLPLVWTPAGSANSVTFYVLSGTIDGLPVELSGDDAGWFLSAPVITVKLTCKPHWYGTPVTFGAISSATPFVLLTLAAVGGDAPSEGRLQITDAASQNRRYIEWGLQQRYYDAAASLLVDSDDMVTTGYSGFQTTRAGAYDPNASGNNVVRGTLIASPTAICSGGTLSHVGEFRVKARVFPSTSTEYIRFTWQEGDGPYRANSYVTPSVGGTFAELDLGLITIPPKQLGTQRWQGQIEAYTTGTAGTDTLDVDYLVLVPAGEGYGKARGEMVPDTPTVFVARDEFGQTAGVLSGKTLPIGGTWTTAGDVNDLAVEATGHTVTRNTNTNETIGRYAVIAATSALSASQVDVVLNGGIELPRMRGGPVLRYTNTSNVLTSYVDNLTRQVFVAKIVAGVTTQLGTVKLATYRATAWSTLRLVADAAGGWWLYAAAQGTSLNLMLSGQDAVLATGGTLATGSPGFFDWCPSSTVVAGVRNYDNFQTWTPTIPTVLYSGRTAEVRWDGAIRQDSTGVYYGPVPAYRGSRFLVPPAGDKNRTSRVLVKAHRNDIEAAASDQVTDNLTIQAIVTPRGIVVPF